MIPLKFVVTVSHQLLGLEVKLFGGRDFVTELADSLNGSFNDLVHCGSVIGLTGLSIEVSELLVERLEDLNSFTTLALHHFDQVSVALGRYTRIELLM